MLFEEFRKRSFEGEYPDLIPRRADSMNFLVFGIVVGHSLLHGGPGIHWLQSWVYEIIAGRNDSESLMTMINKGLIPRHAGSENLLKFISELDESKNQEELGNIIDKYIQILNCSRWDPTTQVTVQN